MFFLFLQLRNNKAKDVCLDQGPPENHTAILYPCHGWGPQVGASLTRKRVNSAAHRGFVGLLCLLPGWLSPVLWGEFWLFLCEVHKWWAWAVLEDHLLIEKCMYCNYIQKLAYTFKERVSRFPGENLMDMSTLGGHHQFDRKNDLVCSVGARARCWLGRRKVLAVHFREHVFWISH